MLEHIYNPDEFLGQRLADALKLDTLREEAPDTLWQDICRKRRIAFAALNSSRRYIRGKGLIYLQPYATGESK